LEASTFDERGILTTRTPFRKQRHVSQVSPGALPLVTPFRSGTLLFISGDRTGSLIGRVSGHPRSLLLFITPLSRRNTLKQRTSKKQSQIIPLEDLIEQVKSKKRELMHNQKELKILQTQISKKQFTGNLTPAIAEVLLDLPDDCPGWGEYNPIRPSCLICSYNIPCLDYRRAIA
jgi:hypothetical protein